VTLPVTVAIEDAPKARRFVSLRLRLLAMVLLVLVPWLALVLFMVVSRLVKAAEARLTGPVPATAAVPATRECPACCETVPARATRCKFCTSELKPA